MTALQCWISLSLYLIYLRMREPHPLSVEYNGVQLYGSTIVASSFAHSEVPTKNIFV